MTKKEIMSVITNISKHVKIIKIDRKANICYSSQFVKVLESIPKMYTKQEVAEMLKSLQAEIWEYEFHCEEMLSENDEHCITCTDETFESVDNIIQKKIEELKGE